MSKVTVPVYNDLLSAYAKTASKPENELIKSARSKGFELFSASGFPTRRDEDWRYTSVTPYLQESFQTNGSVKKTGKVNPEAGCIPDMDCYKIILVNGVPVNKDALPDFIKVSTFEEAKNDTGLLHNFGKAALLNEMPFAALNTALFPHGVFIEVAGGAHPDKPLHLIHVYDAEQRAFIQPRSLMVVHKNASLTLIETIVSGKHTNLFINGMTEVILKEQAHMDHYLIQEMESDLAMVQQTDVHQVRHSVYSNYTFSLPGASLIRNNLHLALDDEQTESHLYGLYLGAGNQLIDNHSLVDHRKPNCNSNEIYKGVLTGKSVGVFNGKVFVRQDAQKTNAFQQNNNLLLDDLASINSKPQLEIFADDVKCSHGSTVGQLSKEAMFYLQSRGISKAAARQLLVNAFAFDVTEKIKIPELEHFINDKITAHIPAV